MTQICVKSSILIGKLQSSTTLQGFSRRSTEAIIMESKSPQSKICEMFMYINSISKVTIIQQCNDSVQYTGATVEGKLITKSYKKRAAVT